MTYSNHQIHKMNSTARSAGAVGLNSIIVKIIKSLIDKNKKILDYGSGPNLIQTKQLVDCGFNVKSWDIGNNLTNSNYFIKKLESNSFDVVFASNVLNVQENEERIKFVIDEVFDTTKNIAILNFPNSPNYTGLNIHNILYLLQLQFKSVFSIYRLDNKNFIYENIGAVKNKTKTRCWICKKV